jgi:ribosomal protein RSM22 (predicted rRNA methylase)
LPISAEALARIHGVASSLHGGKPRALADAVVALSHIYTRERGQMSSLDKGTLLARAGFFFPRDLPKVFGPLDALRAAGFALDKPRLRVLDVGAGLGATSFGVARWLRLRKLGVEALEVVALEHDAAALRVFASFVRVLGELPDEFVPLTLEQRADDLRALRSTEKYDLIVYGFVLNELFLELPEPERAERRAQILRDASAHLAPGGAIIQLEPALKDTTRELMRTRDLLAARHAAPYVIAPCLHSLPCPMLPSERDWCHQELPIALPPSLAEVARAATLRYEGLSYASLVLANTPRPATPEGSFRIVSDRLVSKGKLELFGCGDAGQHQRLTRLDRHQSEANEAFGYARRGDVLTIRGAGKRVEADTKVDKTE